MKKVLIIISVVLIIILNINTYAKQEEKRGVFISYIELDNYIKSKTISESKKNIKKMISNLDSFKLNTIILQVRQEQDAIYKSKIFPYSKHVTLEDNKTFDVLKYFIKIAHKNNIKVVAWINPYRVKTTNDINSIPKDSPVYKYINTNALWIENGIYLNPSKKEVEELILDGVKEVLSYNIDGLLFDDYFYPSNEIDNIDYSEYLKNNDYIDKNTYHLNIVNRLIKKTHKLCKDKNIPFGISPDGNIENNYQKHNADVKTWLKEKDYVDFIIPQIYYGFYNSTKSYIKVLNEWEELIKNKDISLYVALAFYKVGQVDNYAKEGRDEWILNNDIIMREVILSRNASHYKGFILFRYDNIFNKEKYTTNSIEEIENLKKIIK